ncbi:carbohydrate ABC transporter permease [Shouchella lehensis]|uniref:Sugar ABC transporter permease n=1 Tax=Shouchella lehensis TaxID=300825 RepID=A0A4Y7WLV7_9BACI|nr:sugar ABC transporter permease [Shouchella lehensis]MBG9783057.1 sugar ABC transporter permease [Shouchella lehensis]TES49585.1 sugar ABC transporter permease [Shouchella lehensis]
MNVDIQPEQNQTKRRKPFFKQDTLAGWLFLSPMLIGFTVFMFVPIGFAFYMSFTDWPLLGQSEFIGAANYRAIVQDPEFQQVMGNTILFTAGLVPFNILLALGLALLLRHPLPLMGMFRTIVFVPVVTTLVVWAIVWRYMFATDYGFINSILAWVGVEPQAWLYSKDLAMPAVIITSVLKNVGLNMVLFLAALQMVPKNLYEAARIDGAGSWRQFQNITLPIISPTVFLATIITIIGAMKIFAQIFVMTRGGPESSTKVIVYYIWEKAFRLFDMGYASAAAFILFFLIFAFTLIQWWLRKRWVYNED